MTAIYKRELKSYFGGMIAYIVIALMLAFVGFVSAIYNFFGGLAFFEYVFMEGYVVMAIIIAISLLTMRSFADEKKERTDQLLYSLPLNMSSIVMGKYLAMLTVYLIPMLVMCLYPLVLSLFGDVNFLQTYSSILAQILLGASLISIGMFLSSLTETQVIAAVMTIGTFLAVYFMPTIASTFFPETAKASFICFIFLIGVAALIVYALTKNLYAAFGTALVLEVANLVIYLVNKDIYAGAFPDMLDKISIFNRFNNFVNGSFDLTAIIYYLSVICVFVFLTTQSLEKKRYS